jgi:predicted acyl esterase
MIRTTSSCQLPDHREGIIIVEKNVPVTMSDGAVLRVNVYRPPHRAPVVMSMTPYGKDNTPDRIGMLAMRLSRVRFGRLNCSPLTGFESPDPQFWVEHGYAVVQGDTRGMHASGGTAGFLTDRDAADYAELIEWAADRPWSTGAVGLNGVSYLCMSQWRVAALRPRGLRAIVAWEGASDLLREFAYHGGIPETGFVPVWWRMRMKRGSRRNGIGEDFPADARRHPFEDAYWAAKRPQVSAIEVPALVCAGWADHGLHTRGTLLAYEQLSGPKWLYGHGGRKWETYYASQSLALQRRFLDHFLKGDANSWVNVPPVHYEVRRTRERHDVRTAPAWPLPNAEICTLHLDAASATFGVQPPADPSCRHYQPNSGERIRFAHRFTEDTEITGGMALTLWVSTDEGSDLDLFVVIRKRDPAGAVVPFIGYNGFPKDGVAKGWLRASHRETDPARNRPERPWHTHRAPLAITPGTPTELVVEIWPSSTLFESGSELVVEVGGRDADPYPALQHTDTVNRGAHTIHTGPATPSKLVFPVVSLHPC